VTLFKKLFTAGLSIFLILFMSAKIGAQATDENILIILDLSKSMKEQLDSKQTKFEVAKNAVREVMQSVNSDTKIGLRVYGHKSGFLGMNMCSQSQLLVPIEKNNKDKILKKIEKLDPSGVTPIEYSLRKAFDDFKHIEGSKRIVLISDGLETCNGDPCSFAGLMNKKDPEIKVDVISFGRNVKNISLDSQLQCIALKTNGQFSRADTQIDLVKAINSSVQVDKHIYWQVRPNY
jgi:Ca-activated chloride channel family protein